MGFYAFLHNLTSKIFIRHYNASMNQLRRSFILITVGLCFTGCTVYGSLPTTETVDPAPTNLPTLTSVPLTATWTPTSLPSATPTLTLTPEPLGCQKPPDDYTRVQVHGWTINQRTLAMLEHAQTLYGGELDLTDKALTQGSYHDNGAASFGTHLGGGAVDLSVLRYGTYTVLWDDVPRLLQALRTAGFAAWLREYGELYPDSPIHVHAIAIGDAELSQPARDQLTGPAGYFRGYSGLVDSQGNPTPDRYGGPVLCQWMIDLGYRDLR